jgi:hypothetical protein
MAHIEIVSRSKIEWPLLRKTISDATGLQPSSSIRQSHVKFSDAAEALIFGAYLILDITDEDPHDVLLNLPRECLEYLHYTFLIACSRDTVDDLREKTNANYIMLDVGSSYCVLGTGPLSVWYDAITLNLTYPRMSWKGFHGTRLLLNKMLYLFEKEGLQALFSKYNKKQLPDKTFLLE